MRRCHTTMGKASTEKHYRHTQLIGRFHRVAGVQCWQTYNTLLHRKEPSSVSQIQERRNNRDRAYHSLGFCLKLSLCGAGWNSGISREQGLVYHAYCGDIFQEGWCTSSHLTVHHLWLSGAWHLFCSWAAENSHALHQGEFAPVQKCWLF